MRRNGLPTPEASLRSIYWDNVQRLHWTLGYCARRNIKLYRATSALFPMSDEPHGEGSMRFVSGDTYTLRVESARTP